MLIGKRRAARLKCVSKLTLRSPLPHYDAAFDLRRGVSMQQQKPFTTNRARSKEDGKTRLAVLDIGRKKVGSDGIRPFIPPPTREQLMAGSANLRRVYKAE
jgi:hypothetical protein